MKMKKNYKKLNSLSQSYFIVKGAVNTWSLYERGVNKTEHIHTHTSGIHFFRNIR